jgi:hypothetical protein
MDGWKDLLINLYKLLRGPPDSMSGGRTGECSFWHSAVPPDSMSGGNSAEFPYLGTLRYITM